MATSPTEYPPGDPRLVDKIIGKLKSEGIFDQFRRECLDDVDTKPAYHNLHQRVEGTVNAFLSKQEWRPEMNKNQLRESLRKHIKESGYLDIGVERIVDQVMNPKIMTVFMPHVEDVVYRFVGIETPGREFLNSRNTAPASSDFSKKKPKADNKAFDDLLPKDLDPVSPESEADTDFYNKKDIRDSVDNNVSATPDAPTHTPAIDENSMDSRLSAVSGTTPNDTAETMQRRSSVSESQDIENFNNDSQSPKQSLYSSSPVTASSEDLTNRSISQLAKLSINKRNEDETPQDTTEKMDISEINQVTDSNNYADEVSDQVINEPMQCDNVEFMDASPAMNLTPTSVSEAADKDLLIKKGIERRREQNDSGAESSTSKESKESKRDDGASSTKSSKDSDKHGRSHDKHKSRHEEYKKSKSHRDDRREREKSKHRDKDHGDTRKEKSKDDSKHDDSHKDKTKSNEKSHRDKDRKDKDRSHRKDKDSKSSSRENREDSKDSSDNHRERKDSAKSSKDGGGSHKEKTDNKDGKEYIRHHERKDSRDRKEKSSKDSSKSDRDRHRSDKKRDESDSDKGKSPHKSDKKSKDSKGKSVTDDHHAHRDRHSEDRRSTDRDSNGAASFGSHSSNQKQKSESSSSKDSSTSSKGGNNKNKGKQSADGQTRSTDNSVSTASSSNVSTNNDLSLNNKGQINNKQGTGTKVKEPEMKFVAPRLTECDMFNPVRPKKVIENRRISSGNVNNTPAKLENSCVSSNLTPKLDSGSGSNLKVKSEENEKGENTPKQKVVVKRESVNQETVVSKQKSTMKQESLDQETVVSKQKLTLKQESLDQETSVPKQETTVKQECLIQGTLSEHETVSKAENVAKDESATPKQEKNECAYEVKSEVCGDSDFKHEIESTVTSDISTSKEETEPTLILKPEIIDLTLSPSQKRDSSENIITTPTTPISPSSSLPFKKRPVTPSSKNSTDIENVPSVSSENKLLLKKKSKLVTDTFVGKKQTKTRRRQNGADPKNLMEWDSPLEVKELPAKCKNRLVGNTVDRKSSESKCIDEGKEDDEVEDLKYFKSEGDNFFLSGKESKFLNYVYNVYKVVDRSFVTLSLACMFNDIVKTAREMGVEVCDTPGSLIIKEASDTSDGLSMSKPGTSRTPRKNSRSGKTAAKGNVTNQKLQTSPTVEKRELRRTRKPNNRYSSEEYASIFSESNENSAKKLPGENLIHSKAGTPSAAIRRLSDSMDLKNCRVAIKKMDDSNETNSKINESDNLHESKSTKTKEDSVAPMKENSVDNISLNSVSPTKQANNNNESFFNPMIFTNEIVTGKKSEIPNQTSSVLLSSTSSVSEIPKITHTIGAFEVTIESDSDDEEYVEDDRDILQQELILPSLEDLMRESGMIPPTKTVDTSLLVESAKPRQIPRTRYVGLPPPPKKKAVSNEGNPVSGGAVSNNQPEPDETDNHSSDIGNRNGIKDSEDSTPTNSRRNNRRTVNKVAEVRSTRARAVKRRGSGTSDNSPPAIKKRR